MSRDISGEYLDPNFRLSQVPLPTNSAYGWRGRDFEAQRKNSIKIKVIEYFSHFIQLTVAKKP